MAKKTKKPPLTPQHLMRAAQPHIDALVEIIGELNAIYPRSAAEAANQYVNNRPAVEFAEEIARTMLDTSDVEDLGACPLCRG